MSTVTQTRKARQRTIKLTLGLNDEGQNGVVTITVGKEAVSYLLNRIPADYGQGFSVEKMGLDAEEVAYHVNLDGDNKTCDCKGHARWGRCKHADGIAALVKAGKL